MEAHFLRLVGEDGEPILINESIIRVIHPCRESQHETPLAVVWLEGSTDPVHVRRDSVQGLYDGTLVHEHTHDE